MATDYKDYGDNVVIHRGGTLVSFPRPANWDDNYNENKKKKEEKEKSKKQEYVKLTGPEEDALIGLDGRKFDSPEDLASAMVMERNNRIGDFEAELDGMEEQGLDVSMYKEEGWDDEVNYNEALEKIKSNPNQFERYLRTKEKEEQKQENKKEENDDEYKLYQRARINPDSIDPMTENSTDWEALDKKFKKRYENENKELIHVPYTNGGVYSPGEYSEVEVYSRDKSGTTVLVPRELHLTKEQLQSWNENKEIKEGDVVKAPYGLGNTYTPGEMHDMKVLKAGEYPVLEGKVKLTMTNEQAERFEKEYNKKGNKTDQDNIDKSYMDTAKKDKARQDAISGIPGSNLGGNIYNKKAVKEVKEKRDKKQNKEDARKEIEFNTRRSPNYSKYDEEIDQNIKMVNDNKKLSASQLAQKELEDYKDKLKNPKKSKVDKQGILKRILGRRK